MRRHPLTTKLSLIVFLQSVQLSEMIAHLLFLLPMHIYNTPDSTLNNICNLLTCNAVNTITTFTIFICTVVCNQGSTICTLEHSLTLDTQCNTIELGTGDYHSQSDLNILHHPLADSSIMQLVIGACNELVGLFSKSFLLLHHFPINSGRMP